MPALVIEYEFICVYLLIYIKGMTFIYKGININETENIPH